MKNFALVQTIGSAVLVYTIILWGLPVAPALAVFDFTTREFLTSSDNVNYVVYGLTAGVCFMVYIFEPAIYVWANPKNTPCENSKRQRKKIVDKLESWTTIRWAICAHLHRCTHPVLVHTIPSPICNAYYRLAGAKIGKGVQINSINVNDPSTETDRR